MFGIQGDPIDHEVKHQLDLAVARGLDQRLDPVLDGGAELKLRVEPIEILGHEDARIVAPFEKRRRQHRVETEIPGMGENLPPRVETPQHQRMHVINLRWELREGSPGDELGARVHGICLAVD